MARNEEPGQAEQVASTGMSLSHFVTRMTGFFIVSYLRASATGCGDHEGSDSGLDRRAELHFADDVSQDRRGSIHASLVWRAGREALCDDASALGQGEAGAEQSESKSGSVHNSGEGDRARV